MDMSGKERIVLRVPGTLPLQDVTREGRVLVTEDNALVGIMALAPGEKVEKNLSWFDWSLLNDVSPTEKLFCFLKPGRPPTGKIRCVPQECGCSPAIRLEMELSRPSLQMENGWSQPITDLRRRSSFSPPEQARRGV